LREAGRLAASPQDGAKVSLEWMHGRPRGSTGCSASEKQQDGLHTTV
jgi:hypothetical protein